MSKYPTIAIVRFHKHALHYHEHFYSVDSYVCDRCKLSKSGELYRCDACKYDVCVECAQVQTSPVAQAMTKDTSPRGQETQPPPEKAGGCCCFGGAPPPPAEQPLNIEEAGRRTQQRLDKLMVAEAQLTARSEAERVKQDTEELQKARRKSRQQSMDIKSGAHRSSRVKQSSSGLDQDRERLRVASMSTQPPSLVGTRQDEPLDEAGVQEEDDQDHTSLSLDHQSVELQDAEAGFAPATPAYESPAKPKTRHVKSRVRDAISSMDASEHPPGQDGVVGTWLLPHYREQFLAADYVSLECAGGPSGSFLRIDKDGRARISRVNADREPDMKGATFRAQPGLAATTGTSVSFESCLHVGTYLRHTQQQLVVEEDQHVQNWRRDASWNVHPANNDDPYFVSLESVSKRGHFIRVDNKAALLQKRDRVMPELYLKGSSFILVEPLWLPEDFKDSDPELEDDYEPRQMGAVISSADLTSALNKEPQSSAGHVPHTVEEEPIPADDTQTDVDGPLAPLRATYGDRDDEEDSQHDFRITDRDDDDHEI